MDTVIASLSWVLLLGTALGAFLGVLFAAMGKRRHELRAAGKAYVSSFQYALQGHAEEAIEELDRTSGPDTVETWFALGALLRRKGDVSRATRLHEKILKTPGLDRAVRRAAAYELGLDFRKAGMLSRAVEALESVIAEDPSHRDALRELREMCEETGDWAGAIAFQERLGPAPSILAHLHVARARSLLARGMKGEAREAAAAALAACPQSADALQLEGELRLRDGDAAGAIESLAAALDLSPELLSEILPHLEEAFAAHSGYAGLGVFLGERIRAKPDDPLLRLGVARHLRRRGLKAEAATELRRLLVDRPNLIEARQELGEILLEEGTTEELRGQLREVLGGLDRAHRPFACRRCEFELNQFAFRCPRCFAWDTIGLTPPENEPDTMTGT